MREILENSASIILTESMLLVKYYTIWLDIILYTHFEALNNFKGKLHYWSLIFIQVVRLAPNV